jgi:hypothetical protein
MPCKNKELENIVHVVNGDTTTRVSGVRPNAGCAAPRTHAVVVVWGPVFRAYTPNLRRDIL